MSDTKDEIFGRVLKGLRDVAPPDDMESRIVSALQHRASAKPMPTRSPWKAPSLAGGFVFAGVVCAIFFAAHRRMPQTLFPRSEMVAIQAANGFVASPLAAIPKPPKPTGRPSRQGAVPPPGAQASHETSYPAPPMPLTEQEKLLLRLAHKGDPVQLAMLDPAQREAKYADERAQVQRFFTPPKQEITSEP